MSSDSTSAAKAPAENKHIPLRVSAIVAGLALVIGFLLPWVKIGDMARVSGLELLISDNIVIRNALGVLQRRLLVLVPLGGLLVAGLAVRNIRGLRWAMLGVGLALFVIGLIATLSVFFHVTSLGLWLVAIGMVLSLAMGILFK